MFGPDIFVAEFWMVCFPTAKFFYFLIQQTTRLFIISGSGQTMTNRAVILNTLPFSILQKFKQNSPNSLLSKKNWLKIFD